MSVFSLFTAGLAFTIPFASAYTKPVGANPKGNPISQPGLNSLVPAGKSFEVMWNPTTKGSITLVLLKGPSTDAEPLGVIAEGVPNNGMYVWTPSKDLEPSPNDDPTGYGIQLIVDATGQYQYTTQFGISNPSWHEGESWGTLGGGSSSDSHSSTMSAMTTSSAPHSMHTTSANHTSITSHGWTSTMSSSNATVTGTASTGFPHHNTTMVTPTKPMTVPHSLKTSTVPASTTPSGRPSTAPTHSKPKPSHSSPPNTNGASGNMASSFAGLVVAAAVAVYAL